MMDETTKADFISLMQELEGIKIKQSALKQKEENCKADLMEILKDNGMQRESFEHYGSVRIQTIYTIIIPQCINFYRHAII